MTDLATVSVGALLSISLVAVVALVFQLTALLRAARRPWFARQKAEHMPFGVRGGRFQAEGGRGATVHWGAPVLSEESGTPEPAAPDAFAGTEAPASALADAPTSADAPASPERKVPVPRLDGPAVPGARTAAEPAPARETSAGDARPLPPAGACPRHDPGIAAGRYRFATATR